MSIGSILSNPLTNPWALSSSTQSETTAIWSATSGTQCEPQQGGTAASPSDPFQNLASDIQAMLIQAQTGAAGQTASTATASASRVGATGGSITVTPEQQLETDLQSAMSELQGTASPNPQTASTTSSDPTAGQTEHHHHHHHHEDGGGASASTAVADSSTASSSTTASTSASDVAMSQIFASDITQALQAYGGGTGSTMMPAMIV